MSWFSRCSLLVTSWSLLCCSYSFVKWWTTISWLATHSRSRSPVSMFCKLQIIALHWLMWQLYEVEKQATKCVAADKDYASANCGRLLLSSKLCVWSIAKAAIFVVLHTMSRGRAALAAPMVAARLILGFVIGGVMMCGTWFYFLPRERDTVESLSFIKWKHWFPLYIWWRM